MSSITLAGPEFSELAADLLGGGHALRFQARGGSMVPFIKHGDVVEVQPVEAAAIRRGDVVLCRNGGGRVVVHRVVRVGRENGQIVLVVKGDALARPDGRIPPGDVLGQVVAVERGGKRFELNEGRWRMAGRLWTRLWPLSVWGYRAVAALSRRVRGRMVGS